MPETVSEVAPLGTGSVADLIAAAGAWSNQERAERLELLFRVKAAAEGEILVHLGETDRRQAYRDDGATSLESWTAERFGLSTPTARAYAHLAERAWDLPHLVGALCEGDITLDKLRAVSDVASPKTDRLLRDQARGCSVRELADIARMSTKPTAPSARSEHDRRFLRFNDQCRTMSVQLAPESYAELRACIDALARNVASDGEMPLDQRRCDALMAMIHSTVPGASGPGTTASPFVVVVHAPLEALVEDSGEESALGGELERDGLIDGETLRRIACDATVAVAVDDDVGHTMYEGRARRFPSEAQRREVMRRDRHCRFSGCRNVTFTNVHHIKPWKPGGRTDLDNLALLCVYHHGLVHQKGWTMSGNANEELTFGGPSGRVTTSRPSPLWTRVTAGRRSVS